MKPKLYIEYNPYTLETRVLINDKEPKITSFFNIKDGVRIQEWLEKLPESAHKEINESELSIAFKGINMDFDDLKLVCDNYKKATFKLEHIPGEEIQAKEVLVRNIFNEINNGPVEELKGDKIKSQFDSVFNNILKVNVLATMSSGKSTVINAILDKEILPSENKACTAIVFEIIDNDEPNFKVVIKDKSGNEISTHNERGDSKEILEILKQLNDSEHIKANNIDKVELYGNIPFVKSSEEKLVLIDTPGPNNANNEEHGMVTQGMIESSSKDLILYIMDGTTLTSNDSNDLLEMISKSMRSGGLQSRDRFIFVLNKMDNLKENESLEDILKEAQDLLKRHGIENPNIFPVSGLVALKLKSYLKNHPEESGQSIDYMFSKGLYEELGFIKNFNERIHLDKYGDLTGQSNEKIKSELERAKSSGNIVEEAIIHTGIRSLEESISVYLSKYFKTAKVKNISERIAGTIKSVEEDNNLKQSIMETEESMNLAKKRIDVVKNELESGKKAENLYDKVNKISLESDFKVASESIYNEYSQWMTKYIEENNKKDNIEKNKVTKDIENIQKIIDRNLRRYLIKMENQIEDILVKESTNIINEYRKYLREISNDLSFENVDFNMEGVLEANISLVEKVAINEIIDKNTYTEEVIVGTERRTNHNKAWYKPWTWRDSRIYTVDIKEDVEFVKLVEVVRGMISDIETVLNENIASLIREGLDRQETLKSSYKESLKELENELNKKLDDYSSLTKELKNKEEKLRKLDQIANFIKDVNNSVFKLKQL